MIIYSITVIISANVKSIISVCDNLENYDKGNLCIDLPELNDGIYLIDFNIANNSINVTNVFHICELPTVKKIKSILSNMSSLTTSNKVH